MIALLAITCILSLSSLALQPSHQSNPTPFPSSGFWVLESNIYAPEYCIIHFYDGAGQQIYEERIESSQLDLHRRRVRKWLDKVLKQSIIAWQNDHTPKHDLGWVASRFQPQE